jgi:hypothetical protein
MSHECTHSDSKACSDEFYKTLDVDTLKFFHKHTYERIMWYRSEIWRVAIPIWSGYGAFLIAVLSTAVVLRKENIVGLSSSLAVGASIVSVLVNVLFYIYVGRLYRAVDDLNTLMSNREFALSRRMSLFQTIPGFMESDHRYNQHKVFPGLDMLFLLSNLIMTAAIVGIILLIAPQASVVH